jgi:hypothetical protein
VGVVGFERISAMDFGPDGLLYATGERDDGSDTSVLITIDPATGVGTEVGPTGAESIVTAFRGPMDISFRNSDGTLFAQSFDNDVLGMFLGTINTATGAMTLIGEGQECEEGNGIAFSPTDVLLKADDCYLQTLNQGSGVPTIIQSLNFPECTGAEDTDPRINAMDFHPETGVLFGSMNVGDEGGTRCLVTIDTTTANVTAIGSTVGALDAIAFVQPEEPTPTPAPSASPTATPVEAAPAAELPSTGSAPTSSSGLPLTGVMALALAGAALLAGGVGLVRRAR